MTTMPLAQVKALLLVASHLSGYPIPAGMDPPAVFLVSPREMAIEACGGDSLLGCEVIGFYEYPDSGHERIMVDANEAQAEHSASAIAVHELTHWLQYHNWLNPADQSCPREFLREYEAYLAGYRYEVIYERAKAPASFSLPGLECQFTVK